VTGTDTGVGKTAVGCALLRLARDRGHALIPFKPVETGCAPDPLDAFALWGAGRPPVPREDICLYPLPLAAAPAVAADAAGLVIDFDAIVRRANQLQAAGDALLVEGAGGLLVPYRGTATTVELATLLGLPLLVVARAALGTINHTALTLSEIRRRSLPLAGVILVETSDSDSEQTDNANQIKYLTGIAPLGTLRYASDRRPEVLAAELARALGERGVAELLATVLSGL
jgi:dethiobiotin synthetase